MCRAVWVIVVAASDEAAKRLRRAVGADAQVVLMTSDAGDPAIRTTTADVLVIDGDNPGARALAQEVSGIAVLWVGADPPEAAHGATEPTDDLSGAVTKALLASKQAG